MTNNKKIDDLRQKIDTVDSQIQNLLEIRLLIVEDIASVKKTKKTPIEDQNRENAILSPIKNQYVKNVFSEILKQSRSFQQSNFDK